MKSLLLRGLLFPLFWLTILIFEIFVFSGMAISNPILSVLEKFFMASCFLFYSTDWMLTREISSADFAFLVFKQFLFWWIVSVGVIALSRRISNH